MSNPLDATAPTGSTGKIDTRISDNLPNEALPITFIAPPPGHVMLTNADYDALVADRSTLNWIFASRSVGVYELRRDTDGRSYVHRHYHDRDEVKVARKRK